MMYTYVTMDISAPAYAEIAAKIRAAGYGCAIDEDGEIDMHGLALAQEKPCSWCAPAAVGAEKSVGHATPCGPFCGAWKWHAERDATYVAIVTELLFPGTQAAGNHVGFAYIEERLRVLVPLLALAEKLRAAVAADEHMLYVLAHEGYGPLADAVTAIAAATPGPSFRKIDSTRGPHHLMPCGCGEGLHEPTQNMTSSPGYRVCSLGWPIR